MLEKFSYPSIDLSLVPRHQSSDVVLEDTCEGRLVRDAADPARELGVPD